MIKCINFMNLEEINKAIREANAEFPDDPPLYRQRINIQDLPCYDCDFGIEETAKILQILQAASGDLGAKVQISIKEMTGKPIQRKCFKAIP